MIAYAMVVPAGPFPLMCIAFMIAGFGISLQNAHCNGFVASSGGNIATKIGFLHAAYGTHVLTYVPQTGVLRKQLHIHPLARGGKQASELLSLLWSPLSSLHRSAGRSIIWFPRLSLCSTLWLFGQPSADGDRKASHPMPSTKTLSYADYDANRGPCGGRRQSRTAGCLLEQVQADLGNQGAPSTCLLLADIRRHRGHRRWLERDVCAGQAKWRGERGLHIVRLLRRTHAGPYALNVGE